MGQRVQHRHRETGRTGKAAAEGGIPTGGQIHCQPPQKEVLGGCRDEGERMGNLRNGKEGGGDKSSKSNSSGTETGLVPPVRFVQLPATDDESVTAPGTRWYFLHIGFQCRATATMLRKLMNISYLKQNRILALLYDKGTSQCNSPLSHM